MIARLLALVVLAPVALLALGCAGGSAASGEVTIGIHYSRFQPELITVRAGEPVTFTLRNEDPIEHEWIVGSAELHERHRTGTEPYHDAIPTEVTIPALSARETTVIFGEPGDYAYVCHLPGHEAYGMVGTVRVVAA